MYFITDDWIIGKTLSKEHDKARSDLITKLTGRITAFNEKIVVHEVEKKTGIVPPAWFNTGGTTLTDAQMQAQFTSRRRKPK